MAGLEASLARIAAQFETHLESMARRHVALHQEQIDEFKNLDAPEVWDTIRRLTRESRGLQAVHLRAGMTLPESCPAPDLEAVQLAARGGSSLTSVLQGYGIGHSLATEAWLDAVDAVQMPESERRACTRAVTRFVNAYDDRLITLVSDAFQRELGRAGGDPEQRNLRALRQLIEGLTLSGDAIDYELEAHHIGVVGSGSEARDAIRRLTAALGCRFVWAPVDDEMLWAWLGRDAPFGDQDRATIRRFRPPAGCRIALGESLQGLGGFRRSHGQAGEAHVIATRLGRSLTRYQDVRLEAFALRDEGLARELVESALGRLGADGDRSDQLRGTLRAYFAASQNGASAAAALGVHERTVARRLQTIEDLLDAPVNSRRAELELALRLEKLLEK